MFYRLKKMRDGVSRGEVLPTTLQFPFDNAAIEVVSSFEGQDSDTQARVCKYLKPSSDQAPMILTPILSSDFVHMSIGSVAMGLPV